MSHAARPRIKICCISSLEEATLAREMGADALGLVGPMPSGPGTLSNEAIRAIAQTVPPPLSRFLLTSESDADAIVAQTLYCAVDTVQVVRHVDPSVQRALAERLPSVRRVQVIHVESAAVLSLIDDYEAHVDAFLLDSGRPSAATAELGGTGRAHDWSLSAAFVTRTKRPVFLAGGLSASNVAEAIATVRPYGLDLCSHVRTNGALDAAKLRAFMDALPDR